VAVPAATGNGVACGLQVEQQIGSYKAGAAEDERAWQFHLE
jgi:hypothetical protein